MIHYFDASALVKHYVREAGTPAVNRLLGQGTSAISRLTEAEISSAFARRRREGDLLPSDYESALAAFRADLERFHIVELSPVVIAGVHPLVGRHALRAGDALQLASALMLRDRLGEEAALDIVVFDERLRSAARAEGLRLQPRTIARARRR